MKLYIWKDVGYVTGEYHDNGGVAIAAADLASARSAVMAHCEQNIRAEDDRYRSIRWITAGLEVEPDVLDLAEPVELPDPPLWIFPNAGCC